MSDPWYKPFIVVGMLRVDRNMIRVAEKILGRVFLWSDIMAVLSESHVHILNLRNLSLDGFPSITVPTNITAIVIEDCSMTAFKAPDHIESPLSRSNSTKV